MKRSMFLSLFLVAVALVTLGANNSCKDLRNVPLDTTGEYSGTWTFNYKEGGTIVDTKDCACTMTLDQDVNLPFPRNIYLTGTLNINLSCLDEWENWPYGQEYPSFEAVEGLYGGTVVNSDGRIAVTLGSEVSWLEVDGFLDLGGFGESENQAGVDIPEMTRYSGDWELVVSGVVFLGTVTINGTFDVTRVE